MTIKQKQCLLEYLGYYEAENSNEVNNVDALWGPASTAATKRFQDDYDLEPDGIFGPMTEQKILQVVATGELPKVNWEKIKYFTRDEFKCPCHRCGGFPVEPSKRLVETEDRIREHFGAPAINSSGVRCQEHNDELKNSSPNSLHITGKAVDFMVVGVPSWLLLEYVQQQPEVCECYAIDANYVHMGVR